MVLQHEAGFKDIILRHALETAVFRSLVHPINRLLEILVFISQISEHVPGRSRIVADRTHVYLLKQLFRLSLIPVFKSAEGRLEYVLVYLSLVYPFPVDFRKYVSCLEILLSLEKIHSMLVSHSECESGMRTFCKICLHHGNISRGS